MSVDVSLRSYLDLDISLSGEEADMYMRKAIVMALSAVGSLKDLLFVKNIFESLKVSVFLFDCYDFWRFRCRRRIC